MGLLPIVLTTTLFIFLWGLVNYNSFAAKRTHIIQLTDLGEQLRGQWQALRQQLVAHVQPSRIPIPDALLKLRPGGERSLSPLAAIEHTEQWQNFIEQHSAFAEDQTVQQLLQALDNNAAEQYRNEAKRQAAVQDYNQYRQKMPYRYIAMLFGFRAIDTFR